MYIFNDCKSKFTTKSYVTKHLIRIHNIDKKTTKQMVQKLVLNVDVEDAVKYRNPLNECCYYSDISKDDLEFDKWLENIVVREPVAVSDDKDQHLQGTSQQIDDDLTTASQPSATPSPFDEPDLLHIYTNRRRSLVATAMP